MIGIDVVEISRFRDMKNSEMFLRRVFTQNETEYFVKKKNAAKNFYATIAGHFAAKEAFSKAVGTGIRGFSFSDIEVCHDELGKPYIKFGGCMVNAHLTISHSDTVAVAAVFITDDVQNLGMPLYRGMSEYKSLIPVRKSDFNKGDCGRVFIIAGSTGMTGAACLAATGAIRSGSGLVTVGLPKSSQSIAAIKLTEAMTLPLDENSDGTLSLSAIGDIKSKVAKSDVCVFGPGLGKNEDIPKLLDSLLSGSCDMVIDADGLNALAANIGVLKRHANRNSCKAVITPHPGEMARLCDESVDVIQNNRILYAKEFAKEYSVVVVLKGHKTIIAAPDGRMHINESGNPGMASGGTGDVLSGVIGSFIAQGLEMYEAAVLGAFVHGVAGDLAKKDKGEHGMCAGDLAEELPYAIKLILNHAS